MEENTVLFRNEELEDIESHCSEGLESQPPPSLDEKPTKTDSFSLFPHIKYLKNQAVVYPVSEDGSFVPTAYTSLSSTLLVDQPISCKLKVNQKFLDDLDQKLTKAILQKQLSENMLIREDAEENHPHHRSLKFSSRFCVVIYASLLFFLSAFAILCSILIVFVYERNFLYMTETAQNYTTPLFTMSDDLTAYDDASSTLLPLYKVLLIGDSLNRRPYAFWDLGGRLQQAVPDYRLQIYDRSRDSSYISLVAANIEDDVKVDADIAFLLWDTDVSGVDEGSLNDDQLISIAQNYSANVNYVVNTVRKSGVKYIAMAGPILLGENNYFELGYITERSVFEGKNDMLDRYRMINQELARNLTVDYIDLRGTFEGELPSWWPLAKYYLTVDGEHPNDYGTQLIVESYRDRIYSWLPVSEAGGS